MMIELFHDMEWDELEAEAADLGTPPERLEELSHCRQLDVRYWVAFNSSASPETLIRLAQDRYESVRRRVFENPSTPPLVKLWLQTDYRHTISLEEFLKAAKEA